MSLVQSAGKTSVFPAFLFVPILLCAFALVYAAPPEEKFPEAGKPQLDHAPTVLEQAVDRAAVMLLNGKLPANEDGVRFALWLYGEKGDVAYLDVATKMARGLVKTDPIMGTAALYLVAQAGGPTLQDAESWEHAASQAFVKETHAKDPVESEEAGLAWNLIQLAGPAARRDALPYDPWHPMIFIDVFEVSAHQKSMAELVSRLRSRSERAAAFAETFVEAAPGVSDWQLFAKEIPDQFWDAKRNQFVDANAPSKFVQRDNTRAAFALWEAGHIFGDVHLRELGQKAVEGNLETALQDSNAAGIVGLAAGRMSRHPLHIAVVGDPADSLVTALRNAAYFAFEPNKVILNLDPAKDAKRMGTLMYPAEAAPALFVCVETLCSPPVRDPAQVEKQVAEIKKLAAQIEQ